MEKLYKYKKLIIIGLILALIISLIIVFSSNKKKDNVIPNITYQEEIVLFGDRNITLNIGDKYIEPGYYAIKENGEITKTEVKVTSDLDLNKEGTYRIIYSYNNIKKTRNIKVLKNEEINSSITFELKGDNMIILEQGDTYIEYGYEAYDNSFNDYHDKVTIEGNVDTSKPGTYLINYILNIDSENEKILTRQVIVKEGIIDASLSVDNTNYTNSVTVTINVLGDNFSYVRYPDDTYKEDKVSKYIIKKNGTYTFYIYDKSYNYVTKQITINNIDSEVPNGTCTAYYKNGTTSISINANDSKSGIKKYKIYGDSNLLLETNLTTYLVSSKLKSAYIIIYDNAGNYKQVNCNFKNMYDLEVHYINVGREDAIVIRDSDKTIFIDGGSYNKGNKITTYLKDLGVNHIDALIGSHLHYNHIQAQAVLLQNFTIDKIYYPQDLNTCYSKYCDSEDQKYILSEIKKQKKDINIMKVSDNINIGDMNIYCIGPIDFQTKSQNKYRQNYNSLNFILTYGNTKFLFTGDNVQYSNILKKFDKSILDIDVLKYPHHGNASLGKTFVNAISPKYVILTNSKDELSSRSEKTYLKNVGASFYYSYKDGNILVSSDGLNVSIKTNIKASDYKR